jgi:ferredoxin
VSAPAAPRRLLVDWTRCDGHGLCAALAPGLVTADPWGYPVLRPGVDADAASIKRLVAVCPALALRDEGETT